MGTEATVNSAPAAGSHKKKEDEEGAVITLSPRAFSVNPLISEIPQIRPSRCQMPGVPLDKLFTVENTYRHLL